MNVLYIVFIIWATLGAVFLSLAAIGSVVSAGRKVGYSKSTLAFVGVMGPFAWFAFGCAALVAVGMLLKDKYAASKKA